MVIAGLLESLRERGVRLSVVEGELRSEGPRGAITPDLADHIRTHRAQLVAHLQGVRTPPFGRPWLGDAELERGRLYGVGTSSGHVTFICRREGWIQWRHDGGTGEGPWPDFEAFLAGQ